MSDTVDLDIDLDNLDYGDFDDINPDDLDIDNLERELGLVNDTPTKEETSTADDKTPTNTSEPSSNEQAKTTSQDANTVDTSSKTPSAAKIPSSPKATTTTSSTSPSKVEDTTTTTTTSKPKASSSPIASPARHQHGTNGHQQQYNPRMNRGKPFMSGQHHHPPFNPGMMNIKYVLQSLSFLFISLPFLPLLHSPS